ASTRPDWGSHAARSRIPRSLSFNVGTAGAKVFSGPALEEFGYTVKQFRNHQGKWLLVGSPWSGYKQDRKGDIYKCEIRGSSSGCQRLNLQSKTYQYYYPGICAEVNPLFNPLSSFSPALQTCGGPMDIAIIVDGSNSIYPWPPVVAFLKKLLENLDIGPDNTQVSVLTVINVYHLSFFFTLGIELGWNMLRWDTFLTSCLRQNAFLPGNGARPGASKVMVVVTDGESHDKNLRDDVIRKCESEKITRFGIAVLGYYIRNDIDTKNLIAEIKSIASTPTDRYFFNVSAEEALLEIAGSLGDRIFNIEGTGKGGDFQMEMSQVGFSAHQTKKQNMIMLGAVGAYGWSGTVVHYTTQKSDIFPKTAFERILEDRNHSSLLGYSVTTLNDGSIEYYVAGAPRSNHTGQVIVYIINGKGQPTVIDSQRGDQIGSYYGSVLCPLDVDKDGVSDLLLVGAPMFMNEQQKEIGKVHLLSFTKGILSVQGFLKGPSPVENARFGMSISAVPDLNMDGYSDVVVGAPLEDNNKGVIYVFNGDKKRLRTQFSQKILGSKLDPALRYFGRSMDASSDLNDDTIPDVSVGAYGMVVQLWSRGMAVVTARATFNPDTVSILTKTCRVSGRLVSCFNTSVCFSATFRPKIPVGPVAIRFNLTLDAELQSSRVTSRGQFRNSERVLQKDIRVSTGEKAFHCKVYLLYSAHIPFSKDCGSDDVCLSDLLLKMLVSFKDKRLSFTVSVTNKKENAYNTQVTATYSKNLFYASISPPSDGTEVKCTSTKESLTLSCQVGYPALRQNQEVTFGINFDFNLNQLQTEADVSFEALSDSTEANPSDNQASISVPVHYDSEISLSREANLNFYVVDMDNEAKTAVNTFNDIGPEFKFSLKVSTGNFPVSLAYLTVSLRTLHSLSHGRTLHSPFPRSDTAFPVPAVGHCIPRSRGRTLHSRSRCRTLHSHSRGRTLHSHSRGRTLHSLSRGRTLHSLSRGRTLHSLSRGRTLHSLSRGRTLHSLSRGRTLHSPFPRSDTSFPIPAVGHCIPIPAVGHCIPIPAVGHCIPIPAVGHCIPIPAVGHCIPIPAVGHCIPRSRCRTLHSLSHGRTLHSPFPRSDTASPFPRSDTAFPVPAVGHCIPSEWCILQLNRKLPLHFNVYLPRYFSVSRTGS
uniref:Integrin subunit alpha 2 n=1 Tax=Oncorhynchus mykiss TaxID=8022 RepID=A0A8C7SWK5_ONCMY